MARHPFGPRAGLTARNLTYIVFLALLFIMAVIAFIHGPSGRNEAELIEIAPTPDADTDVNVAEVNKTTALLPPAEVELEPNLPEIALGPTRGPSVEPNPEAAELIAEATALISEKPSRIIEARDRLNEALRMPMSPQQRAFVKGQLSELADKWLFSKTVLPDDELCGSYRVKQGDVLTQLD